MMVVMGVMGSVTNFRFVDEQALVLEKLPDLLTGLRHFDTFGMLVVDEAEPIVILEAFVDMCRVFADTRHILDGDPDRVQMVDSRFLEFSRLLLAARRAAH